LAAASGQGGVAGHLGTMVRALETFGFDVILIETVGAGQGDVVVRDLADVVALLVQPEAGDELQWGKAGVLEVADVVVVNKSDLPGAERAEAQVKATLELSGNSPPPVLRASGKTGQGVADLWKILASCSLHRTTAFAEGRDLLRLAQEALAARFVQARAANRPELQSLMARWQEGNLGQQEATEALLQVLVAP